MEKRESPEFKGESWEVVKELSYLSDAELRERFQTCSPWELEDIKGACYKADPGGSTGSDGGTHIARANAAKAGMALAEFMEAIRRIDEIVWEVKRKKANS